VNAVDFKLYMIVQPHLSKDFPEPLSITSTSFVHLCACMYKRDKGRDGSDKTTRKKT